MNDSHKPDGLEYLAEIQKEAADNPDPQDATERLLRKLVSHSQASGGQVYRLDLSKAAYVPFATVGCTPTQLSISSVEEKAVLLEDTPLLGAVRGLKLVHVSKPGQPDRLVVPVRRGNACIGILDLRGPKQGTAPNLKPLCDALAGMVSLLFEKAYSIGLFRAIQQPVDYYQPRSEFLNDLLLLISDASGMPYIVLREYDSSENSLNGLAQMGFSENRPLEEFSISPVSKVPSFERAVLEKASVIEPDIDAAHLDELKNVGIDPVKSFVVVPVVVGKGDVFGTLSFGCALNYNFTSLEVAGFESIANSIGVSYTNFRNFHSKHATLVEKLSAGAGFTAVDVAQAVRHEARGHLGTARELLAKSLLWSRSLHKGETEQAHRFIGLIDETLGKLSFALDKIKVITKPVDLTRDKVGLRSLWEETFAIIQGRLTLENIHVIINGKNIEICVAIDPLRHAFLNIVLNSIDAFRAFGRKRGREITVSIDPTNDAERDIYFRYADNAGGFDPASLKGPDLGKPFVSSDIFVKGVSSKKGGSGYGLYIARSVISDQGGSIDLTSHWGGIQFDMSLPKPSQSAYG